VLALEATCTEALVALGQEDARSSQSMGQ
jgi:hypothetical protein